MRLSLLIRTVLIVMFAALFAPVAAQASELIADDPADAQASVSGAPTAPDVSRLEISYDPSGSVTLTVRFYGALDKIDASQNYAFYSSFAIGTTKAGYQSYSCDTTGAGAMVGQHHVFHSYLSVFNSQATIVGFDGLLQFTRTTAADQKSITITASSPTIANRDYNCATYTVSGRRYGPAENINTRYDSGCNCWYFNRNYDAVGTTSDNFSPLPVLFFGGYQPPALPICGDGVDNDGDGKLDLADGGCKTSDQQTEAPVCDDHVDNDGDGKVDIADPDCGYSSSGTSEGPPIAACANGRDDDGDGKVDVKDPGCRGNTALTAEVDPEPVESTFKLRARARGCVIETSVEVLPDLLPAKLFPFGRVRIAVTRGSLHVVRKLKLGDDAGYNFRVVRPGRYVVTGSYLGDDFRLATSRKNVQVTVGRHACRRK